MHSDPDVRKYVGGAAWPVEKAATRFRERYLGKPKKTDGLWATVLVADGSYVGMCGLSGSSTDARLAYYIAKPHWAGALQPKQHVRLWTSDFEPWNCRASAPMPTV